MNTIVNCLSCKYHIKKSVSTKYILSFCLKYNTFASISCNNENLCGPTFRKHTEISKINKK